jgi:hypothetical protein
MPLYLTYNMNVPFGPDYPGDDQPDMLTNTQSINSWVAVDHVGFNSSGPNFGAGIHKKVTLFNMAAPGLGDGQGVLYANLIKGNSWPVWQNILGSFNLMTDAPIAATNGAIYLPGGILLQWGTKANAGATGSVTYNITPFPSGNAAFTIQLTAYTINSGSSNRPASVITSTSAGFTYGINSGNANDSLFWFAIGN